MYRTHCQESSDSSAMDFSNSGYSGLYSSFYQLSIYYESDSDTESIVSIEQRFGSTHITAENPILDVKLPNPRKSVTKQLFSLSSVSDHMPWNSEILCNYFQALELKSEEEIINSVNQGISFKAVCNTSKCKLKGNSVYVNFGMCVESNQVCNFAEYMYEVVCPSCRSQIKPDHIISVVFKDCAVKIKYKMCSEKNPKVIHMCAQEDNYIGVNMNKDMNKYNYIQFTLSINKH